MKPHLESIEPFVDDNVVRAVVETPRGSHVKLAFDPDLRTFAVTRGLTVGVSYPYDWGFIPGTRAEDGDPVDAMILHESPTYPGVVIDCRVLGMVEISQLSKKHGRETNNRLLLVPVWYDRMNEVESVEDLPKRMRLEIEHFFLDTTFFTTKEARCEGFASSRRALDFLRTQLV